MSNTNEESKQYAETYGGTIGGALPMLTTIGLIVIFSLLGLRAIPNLWCAGFAGMIVGFIVYKDKDRYQKALVAGATSPTFAMTLLILIVASVMGRVFMVSHLGDALLYILSVLNVPAAVVPLATFLVGAIISMASGSSSVVNMALIPVLVPLGVQMGCNPGLMLGAVVSGAVFGDNLAPISDSTIVSALTQDVDVSSTVRTRIKYSIAAGIPSIILFLIFGFMTTENSVSANLAVDSTYVISLIFLLLPVFLIIMVVKKINFMVALLIGDLAGIIMLFLFGFTDFQTLVSADGVIASGINSMLEVIITMLFMFMNLALIQETGVMDKLAQTMYSHAKSERSVEAVIGAFVCAICALTTTALNTMVVCGPIIRKIAEPYKISRTRTANCMGGLSNGVQMLLPYGTISLVVAMLASNTGVVEGGMVPLDYIPFNFYCIMLIIVYWFAILTGWGRDHEKA